MSSPAWPRAGGTTDQAARRRTSGDISARVAGAGAIAFAIIVIVQNLIRGGSAPGNDATSTEVLTHCYQLDSARGSRLTAVFTQQGGRWKVSAFHNALVREAA